MPVANSCRLRVNTRGESRGRPPERPPAIVRAMIILPLHAGRPVRETPRLRLRELTGDDAAFILELVNEPGWLRFIGDRNVHSLEDARGYIERVPRASYAKNGFGLWAVDLRETGERLGMCGLIRRESLPYADIGFAFLERH